MLLQQNRANENCRCKNTTFRDSISFFAKSRFLFNPLTVDYFWAFWIPLNSRFVCITSYHRLCFFFLRFVSIFHGFTSLCCILSVIVLFAFLHEVCFLSLFYSHSGPDTRHFFKVIPVLYYFSQTLKHHIGGKHFVHCTRQRNCRVLGMCEYVI